MIRKTSGIGRQEENYQQLLFLKSKFGTCLWAEQEHHLEGGSRVAPTAPCPAARTKKGQRRQVPRKGRPPAASLHVSPGCDVVERQRPVQKRWRSRRNSGGRVRRALGGEETEPAGQKTQSTQPVRLCWDQNQNSARKTDRQLTPGASEDLTGGASEDLGVSWSGVGRGLHQR